MKSKKIPHWLRETLSVVGAMSVLLIAYNLVVAAHADWTLVPIQIVVALVAVGAWRFLSERSQKRQRTAAQKQAEAAKQRAEARRQAERQAASQAKVRRQRNQDQQRHHLK